MDTCTIQEAKTRFNKILLENENLDKRITDNLEGLLDVENDLKYKIKVCSNTKNIINDALKEFEDLTSIINKNDISFFIFSIILQGGIKYLIKKLRMMNDKELAENTPFHKEEHSIRSNIKRYYVTKDEIEINPVPFDAIRKEYINKWYKDNNEIKPGFSGGNHRTRALGHDPILGLIFGTANIMTSTITRYDLISWHVSTMKHEVIKRGGNISIENLDTICERASTTSIFSSIIDRLRNEGTEGWITLGYALLKEIVHLFSDLPSKQSLPIPIISVFSPDLAKDLSLYGLNTGTVVQGGIAVKLTNWIIGFLHGLMRKDEEDVKLYKVRTEKIIMYSNIFSTISDLGYTLFISFLDDTKAMQKFDLGGYLVSYYQICSSSEIIAEIERTFITNKIINQLTQYNNYNE